MGWARHPVLSVDALVAKTRLFALLERVAQGEEVLIIRHGKPVARLVPAGAAATIDHATRVVRLEAARQKVELVGWDWRELRDEGRR